MASLIVISVILLVHAKRSLAAPAPTGSFSKECVRLEIALPINATNYYFDYPKVDNNIDAVDWVWNLTTWSHGNTTEHITGVNPVNATFTIDAQLCIPPHGEKSDILQIASHGIGFDKRYWDVEVKPDEYSYVNAALRHGYSILTYDRLGTGNSTKADAYDVLQTGVEIEVVRGLTELARAGELLSASRVTGSTSSSSSSFPNATRDAAAYMPRKVVHVGHSYGSFMTSGLLARHGGLSDGAILTGLLSNEHLLKEVSQAAFGLEFAAESDPVRFGDRPSGYIVQRTLSNVQQIFLKKGTFEPELLSYAELVKQPAAVGEFVSAAQAFGQPALDFTGPVQIFVGEDDFPVCDGDCNNVYDVEDISRLYPAAKDVSVYLQPGTGHGLTLSTNATAGYEVMFSYLDSYGL